MQDEIKQQWLELLRSKPKKAKQKLKGRNGGKCCLGHLRDLPLVCELTDPNEREYNEDSYLYHTAEVVGLSYPDQEALGTLNDENPGFEKVIEYIEREL